MADIQGQLTRVRDAANDIAGSAVDRIKDGTESATGMILTGRDKASEAFTDVKDKSQRAATRANEIIQEHPIAAAAAAVAAGAVIAYLFPKSRAAMRAMPGVASAIGTRAVEAALAARTLAEHGAETVKARAGDAIDAARDGAIAAKDSAVAVKDQAVSSDIATMASRIADDMLALVVQKAEAVSDAFKNRLPKK
ncbi:hypothetical protein WG908_12970 [Sphingobium sp. AN641]|uniref:hypothetical protein n=1 Tax=Sphingobium sp. AN641 TaxID=3133443 RepID=UPI0030BA7652